MFYSHLQNFKTRHDFQSFLCYAVRSRNLMFSISFGVCVGGGGGGVNYISISMLWAKSYAFGEIHLYNVVWR